MSTKKLFDPDFHTESETVISQIKEKKSDYWEKKGEERALEIFHAAATRVPAYKDFLKKNNVSHLNIRSFSDFKKVPVTNKKNYINEYPLKELAWDGKLDAPSVFTSTSGSTGEQTYFFRSELVDWQYSVIQELFFKNAKDPKKPTLVVVCFGMGIWIGGIITYEAISQLSHRGYPISLVTPGINKAEIFKILKKVSPQFHQTVVIGYPPFLKDIIDEAPSLKIDLSKLNVRIITAAEAYSEDFRDYISKAVKLRNPILDTMSIYGSAEIGAMAFETPTALQIRRVARKNENLFKELFNLGDKTPTLAQFIPSFVNFEEVDGELLLTGNSAMPLIRYAIGDRGGVYSHDEMLQLMKKHKLSIPKTVGDHSGTMHLPFVYVFERNDLSTTLYGLQIYPETIREVLITEPFVKLLTGKFTLVTKYNSKQDQYLEINLEISKNNSITDVAKTQLLNALVKNLLEKNSEYKELNKFIGNRAYPRLVFWSAEDPKYFRPGVKQSWVKKS